MAGKKKAPLWPRTRESKPAKREKLEELIAAYLLKGGKIAVCQPDRRYFPEREDAAE